MAGCGASGVANLVRKFKTEANQCKTRELGMHHLENMDRKTRIHDERFGGWE